MSERAHELIAQLVWATEQYEPWVEIEDRAIEQANAIVDAAYDYMAEQGIAEYVPPTPPYQPDYSI